MAWRFNGHARVNPRNPEAFGICDRCGWRYNLNDLSFQHDWRGNRLMNLNIRVCNRCYDTPFEHFRPIIVPPDPIPVFQPRPDQYAPTMPYLIQDSMGRQIMDSNGQPITAYQGFFAGQINNAVSPPTGLANQQYLDAYAIEAPNGTVILPIMEDEQDFSSDFSGDFK
jgi:hypothetical protein